MTWLSGERIFGPSSLYSREKLGEVFLQVQPLGRIAELRNAILAFYTRIHEEHWLRDKLEEGRLVILEDESIWEVHPWDRQIAKRWLRVAVIDLVASLKRLANLASGRSRTVVR